MNRTEKLKNKINQRLLDNGQTILIEKIEGTRLVFSNGQIINDQLERDRMINRLSTSKTTIWVENFDNLIAGIITDHEIRSQLASLGGKACQSKHGDKIRKNLNTGTPWSKGKRLIGRTTKEGKIYQSWNTGKNKYNCESLAALSKARIGKGNPRYGKTHSDEYKRQSSQRMKDKIASGKFTPNSNNRQTHYDVQFNGVKYRSSWEAVYHQLNPDAEYETLRIPYEFEGKTHIYIVDFVNHCTREVIEVKPVELFENDKMKSKIRALEIWSEQNNYRVVKFTQHDICKYQSSIRIDEFDIKTQGKIQDVIKRNQ